MKNPYINEHKDLDQYLRIAKVTKVYDATEVTAFKCSSNYGMVTIEWIDGYGNVDQPIQACVNNYNNIYGCGIVMMPSVGDLVTCLLPRNGYPIIIGWLPNGSNIAAMKQLAKTIGETSLSGLIAPFKPLYSGEIILKGIGQSELYLDRAGSIHLNTYDPIKTNVVDYGNTKSNIIDSINNLDTEVVSGITTPEYTLSGNNDADSVFINKYRHRILDTLIYSEQNIAVTDSTCTLSKSNIVSVLSLTCSVGKLILGKDFVINDTRDGLVFYSLVSFTITSITYVYENSYYKKVIDSLGNVVKGENSSEIHYGTTDFKSNQNSIIVGSGGEKSVNLQYLDEVIEQRLTKLLNNYTVNFTSSINLNFISTTSVTSTKTFTVDLSYNVVLATNLVDITSVTGTRNGNDFIFKKARDFRINDDKTGVLFTNNYPDLDTDLTITYTIATDKGGISMNNGNITLKSASGTTIEITDQGVFIDGAGAVNLGGQFKLLSAANPKASAIGSFSEIKVCDKVTGI